MWRGGPSFPIMLLLLFTSGAHTGRAQQYTNDKTDDALFVYEVKQIDEFLERFNDEHFSFIRNDYRARGQEQKITRMALLTRLFNLDNPHWNADTLRSFLHDVLNPDHPVILSFTDTNWYAEASCTFSCKGKALTLPVFFHVKTTNPDGARWMITGLGSTPLIDMLPDAGLTAPSSPKYHFIPTSSHINRFLALHRAFADTANLTDYFEPYLLQQAAAKKLIHGLHDKSIQLVSVDRVKFHFFQVSGWFFTVERFERNTSNKGWLINRLLPVSDARKQAIRAHLIPSFINSP